jgi:DNA-binding transcriptional MerR regulator
MDVPTRTKVDLEEARSHSSGPSVFQAFTQELASRITGLSRRQLDYWDRTGVISPSIAPFEGRGMGRLYSFKDLIKLKVGAEMRKRRWRPSRIRMLSEELEHRGFDDPLVTVQFLVPKGSGQEILVVDPGADQPVSARHLDQLAEPMDVRLQEIRTGLETTIARIRERRTGRVRNVRDLQGSQSVIEGTRVPTARIRVLADRGWEPARILAAHPHLTEADVLAALRHEDRRRPKRSA